MEKEKEAVKGCNNNDCLQCVECWSYVKANNLNQDEVELSNMANFITVKEDDEYIVKCTNFIKL